VLQSMRSAAKWVWWFLILAFVGGFLLYETSGLSGRAAVTTNTAIATVNGEEVLLTTWQNAVAGLEQQEQQRLGRALTLDERRTLEDNAFDDLVNDLLLRQEYERRGITVTDDEILQAARNAPPPQAMQSPDLQTDGQFDIDKYRRLISSPSARQSGMLAGLEQYYRVEIPKQKLFEQIASGVYVTDERLWQVYRDRNDSAQVSYVLLRPELLTDTTVDVTEAEISRYYESNKKRFERPARAVVSLLTVPRVVSAQDSASAKARIERLRAEIAGGAKFEDVAKRESSDSVSGAQGGALGRGTLDRFAEPFANAARRLAVGELSQPVLTSFGWHVIRVDSRRGDTSEVRHILVPVEQTDSSAVRTDRRADSLFTKAGNLDDPKKFDEAAKELGLTPAQAVVFEKEPLTFAGKYIPSVSAWAFSGTHAGETSELFDAPDAYYLARVDSIFRGGQQELKDVRTEIVRRLTRDKRIEKLRPIAQELLQRARAGTLEAAAAARQLPVEKTGAFSRVDAVPGLGQFTEAIGAAFTVPVGSVGGPVRATDGLVLMRVDRRVDANRAAFEAQKEQQQAQLAQSLRQQRVQEYMISLRESVSIEDNRASVMSALRRQDTAAP
jgi:peptidyl-prolyl cis-trans isomerase D